MLILLDIGNVMLNVNFQKFCTAVSQSEEQALNIYNEFCHKDSYYKSGLDTGKITANHFIQTIAEVSGATPEKVTESWQNIFTINDDAVESFRKLKERFNMCIASVTDPIHHEFMKSQYQFMQEIEKQYVSYQMGVSKSNTLFFEHIIFDQHITDPQRVLLIDDRIENCLSAQACGMKYVHFNNWRSCLKTISDMVQEEEVASYLLY